MTGFLLLQSSRPGGRDEPRAAAPPSLCGLLGGARAAVAVGPASWGGGKAARHAFFVRLYTVVGLVVSIFQVVTRFNQSTSRVLIRVYPRFGKFILIRGVLL